MTSDNNQVFQACGPGWQPIIEPLIAQADADGAKVMQIKEKFGGLRFYVDDTTEKLQDMITQAEATSFKTCEMCGKPGVLRNSGSWLKTLCDDDAKNLGYRKKA